VKCLQQWPRHNWAAPRCTAAHRRPRNGVESCPSAHGGTRIEGRYKSQQRTYRVLLSPSWACHVLLNHGRVSLLMCCCLSLSHVLLNHGRVSLLMCCCLSLSHVLLPVSRSCVTAHVLLSVSRLCVTAHVLLSVTRSCVTTHVLLSVSQSCVAVCLLVVCHCSCVAVCLSVMCCCLSLSHVLLSVSIVCHCSCVAVCLSVMCCCLSLGCVSLLMCCCLSLSHVLLSPGDITSTGQSNTDGESLHARRKLANKSYRHPKATLMKEHTHLQSFVNLHLQAEHLSKQLHVRLRSC